MRWGRIAIWVLAVLPGVILAAISGVLLFSEVGSFSINAKGPPNGTQLDSWMNPAVLISGGTLLISTVGTISTIWLAWRNEARESREAALKIQQLEMQVTELRAKSSPMARSSSSES
jgi:hypothetical protein